MVRITIGHFSFLERFYLGMGFAAGGSPFHFTEIIEFKDTVCQIPIQ